MSPAESAIPPVVRIEWPAPGVALLVMDTPGKSANVLSREFQLALAAALDEVSGQDGVETLVLSSGKPRIFVAGADLTAIVDHLDWPEDEIREFCHFGRRLYQRFQEGPWTSVAAIQGACVGGGLELALGCDYRVAVDDSRPMFGLPETRLGLIPGWAGTVRLPRMMELDLAIELIASGRLFSAREAHGYGLVDELASADGLLATAMQLAANETRRHARLARRRQVLGRGLTQPQDPSGLVRKWRERIQSSPSIWPFAPEVLARHMIGSADMDFENACQSESRAMAAVWGSPPSHGLINHFFLGEHNRRSPGVPTGQAKPGATGKIGIVGCGVMGRAIARLASEKGQAATLFDASPEAAKRAAILENGQLAVADELSDLAGCDLVIESVPEELPLKQEVLAALSQAVPATTLIASNTSTLPIHELSGSVVHPQRFCGIHFCHPGLLELVEVVPGPATAPAGLATALAWIRGLGKTPVGVVDQPGFVVNRLLPAIVDTALELLGEGNEIGQVDAALRGLGMTGGPFEMMDEIGIDTLLKGGRELARRGMGSRNTSPALARLVRHRRLGRKAGCGFYRWTGSPTREPDPETARLLADCVGPLRFSSPRDIQDRVLVGLLVRATALLEAGAVHDPRDIDLCLIRGLGFPAQLGGILFWADFQGPVAIRRLLDVHATDGDGWSRALVSWLEGCSFFYPHGSRDRRG